MPQQQGPFLVTGAAGQLGRRVLDLLLARGVGPIIATTRSPDKLADFGARGVEVRPADFTTPDSLDGAFRGARRVLLISTDSMAPGQRLAQHRAAIEAARRVGVSYVVYTSLTAPGPRSPITFAGDHWGTEQALERSGIAYTVLRNNLYTDFLVMSARRAVESGQLVNACGDGLCGYVTREDCARAAAVALAEGTALRTLDITGPALVSQAEIASLLASLSGKPVRHLSITADQLAAGMAEHGLPRPVADILASLDTAVATHTLAVASNDVESLTGQQPTSVAEFLAQHRAAFLA